MIGPESSEHQMTVDECIEVAEHNLDGKNFPADGRAAAQEGRGRAMAPDVPPHLPTPCLSTSEAVRHYLHRKDHK